MTSPDVPPPERPLPAVTEVMSPDPDVPQAQADPFQMRVSLELQDCRRERPELLPSPPPVAR